MGRRIATLVAMSALALALSASPALASPVTVFSFPAAGETIGCGDHTYTFTSGDLLVVARDPSLAAHLTLNNVKAVDQDGKSYRVVGAETYNDPAGRITIKVMFVSQGGGIADSFNIIARYRDGIMFVGFDQGTCGF